MTNTNTTPAARIEEITTFFKGLTNEELLEQYANTKNMLSREKLENQELQDARDIAKALIMEKMNN